MGSKTYFTYVEAEVSGRSGKRSLTGNHLVQGSLQPSPQPPDRADHRDDRGSMYPVWLLRAGVSEPQSDDHATAAHRAAPGDGAAARRLARDWTAPRRLRLRRHSDLRGRRLLLHRLSRRD